MENEKTEWVFQFNCLPHGGGEKQKMKKPDAVSGLSFSILHFPFSIFVLPRPREDNE